MVTLYPFCVSRMAIVIPAGPAPMKRIDRFNEPDGADRQEIFHFIICTLIFSGHMRHQP